MPYNSDIPAKFSGGVDFVYSLDELFRGSTHKASVFMPETVKWLENRIAMKPARGGEVPYVKCIVRNKEVRLTPVEYAMHFGREVKRADGELFTQITQRLLLWFIAAPSITSPIWEFLCQ